MKPKEISNYIVLLTTTYLQPIARLQIIILLVRTNVRLNRKVVGYFRILVGQFVTRVFVEKVEALPACSYSAFYLS